MASLRKVLEVLLSGRSDQNIRFGDVVRVLRACGFAERTKGDHFIFSHERVGEIINIQPLSGGKAKAYQVRQVREILARYGLI